MLAVSLTILVVIITAVLIFAARRPNDFVISRAATIGAPAEAIFPLIGDFRRWPGWSPYEKLDPGVKRALSGADSGKGAVYAWEGNGKAGTGRMEITDAAAPSRVSLKLDFEKPFRASNLVDFTLTPAGDGTRVTWAMSGARPFIAKLMGLFMNFDTMIGKDFEIAWPIWNGLPPSGGKSRNSVPASAERKFEADWDRFPHFGVIGIGGGEIERNDNEEDAGSGGVDGNARCVFAHGTGRRRRRPGRRGNRCRGRG